MPVLINPGGYGNSQLHLRQQLSFLRLEFGFGDDALSIASDDFSTMLSGENEATPRTPEAGPKSTRMMSFFSSIFPPEFKSAFQIE